MSASLEQLLRDARIDLILSRIEKDSSVIDEVIEQVDNDIRSIRFNSIFVLGELGEKSGRRAVSKIKTYLKDNDWSIRRECARSLGKIGPIADEAINELSSLVNDNEVSIRSAVVSSLGMICSPTDDCMNTLKKGLKDKDVQVRTEAAKAIGYLGPDAYDLIPDLMKSMRDPNWTVRTAAAMSISSIGKGSIKAIPTLIEALNDHDWRVRYRVVTTLAEIGEPSIQYIMNIINHSDYLIRKGAVEALGELRVTDPEILEKLAKLLFDKKEVVRGRTADSLRNIGKPAVPYLVQALQDSRTKMKILIISSLGGIGIDAEESIPDLINLMRISKNKYIRVEIARTLGKIGIRSNEALNILEQALLDPKDIVRREAALSIGKFGPSGANAVPSLIKALSDKNRDVRWRITEALGKIKLNTDEVVSALKGLIHDECDYVCATADLSLDEIIGQDKATEEYRNE